jgi:uncharacterized membrane protein
MWMPMAVPQNRPMMDPWPILGFWTRAIGFFLLFLGTLIVVIGATPGGGCYTSPGSCGTSFLGQMANSIWAAKILWALGLGALGAGAAIRLHWGLRMPDHATPEQLSWIASDRRANATLFVLSIVLMMVLLLASYLVIAGAAVGL